MIEKIKYIYELQKYGFQRKTQLVSMLIMYVIGLVMEVVSHGTYWLGMFFMMMTPLFVTQTLYSTCMSGLVAASPRGKQIQTSLAWRPCDHPGIHEYSGCLEDCGGKVISGPCKSYLKCFCHLMSDHDHSASLHGFGV